MDEGQERGEIATRVEGPRRRHDVRPQDIIRATLEDLGITRQRLHEARKLDTLSESAIEEDLGRVMRVMGGTVDPAPSVGLTAVFGCLRGDSAARDDSALAEGRKQPHRERST